jgi:hypothetical protein
MGLNNKKLRELSPADFDIDGRLSESVADSQGTPGGLWRMARGSRRPCARGIWVAQMPAGRQMIQIF